MHTLYMLTFKNGKRYIGQTVRKLTTRISQHRTATRAKSLLAVHCAWRLHGEPDVSIISTHETQEELSASEIEAIKVHDTLSPNGYNVAHGGETSPAKNPEVAKKIGQKVRGLKRTNEQKAKMSVASLSAWSKQEYREKISGAVSAGWTEEVRAKKSEQMKAAWAEKKANGWVMPESTKQKLRSVERTAEWISKNKASNAGKPRSPRSEEAKLRQSAAIKKYWDENPEERASRGVVISAAKKAKKMTQEAVQ
jgi:hypothetical protein